MTVGIGAGPGRLLLLSGLQVPQLERSESLPCILPFKVSGFKAGMCLRSSKPGKLILKMERWRELPLWLSSNEPK